MADKVKEDLDNALGSNWQRLDDSGWQGYKAEYKKREGNALTGFFEKFNIPHHATPTDEGYEITLSGSSANGIVGMYYREGKDGETLQQSFGPKMTADRSEEKRAR